MPHGETEVFLHNNLSIKVFNFSSLLNLVLLLVVGMLVISWLKFLMANKSNKIASFMEQFLGICIYIRLQLRTWALGELRIDAWVPVF